MNPGPPRTRHLAAAAALAGHPAVARHAPPAAAQLILHLWLALQRLLQH